MNPNFRKIYDRIKKQSEILGLDIPDSDLKRKAWVLRDKEYFESSLAFISTPSTSSPSGGGSHRIIYNGFSGYYDPTEWNPVDPDDSSIDSTHAPDSITLNGVDERFHDGNENSYLDFTRTSPAGGRILFDWSYSTQDGNYHTISTTSSLADIGLFNNGSEIQIKIRPRYNFDGIISSITFTLRWRADSNIVLGSETQPSPYGLLIPIDSGSVIQSGVFNYKTYTGVGSFVQDEALITGEEYTILTIPITGNGLINIFNDDWTERNNGDYFISLSGVDETGIIYTLPAPSYDKFVFLLNDDIIQISDSLGEPNQSGTFEISINEGDLFGFRIDPTDGLSGRAIVTISKFDAPVIDIEEIEAPII